MLITIENILSPDQLKEVKNLLLNSPWESGKNTAGFQAKLVKNNLQIPDGASTLETLQKIVLDNLYKNSHFFSAALPLRILPPSFNRYTNDTNFYGFHVDNTLRFTKSQSDPYLRSDISATLFLNEPEEYEGGHLIIRDTFGEHGIKLKAGSVVIYPSSSVHCVSAVTQGERFACFMFLQSLVRDPEKRRMLYDMDMSLLELRRNHGDIPRLLNLTNIYNNLLRMWIEN
jgi:PKHD-type hydroxylase